MWFKNTNSGHSRNARLIRRYANDASERPQRKVRLMIWLGMVFMSWLWTIDRNISGLAWIAVLVFLWAAWREVDYLLHGDPTENIISDMEMFWEDKDYI